MIFTGPLYNLVLAGQKTQTRRPCKDGDETDGMQVHQRNGRLRWRVGKTYAVQSGRGKPAGGWLRLDTIAFVARAGEIDEPDALAEGFASPDAFREAWASLYGREALETPCWRLEWKPGNVTVGDRDGGPVGRAVRQRWPFPI
jgi:hypothetical protein